MPGFPAQSRNGSEMISDLLRKSEPPTSEREKRMAPERLQRELVESGVEISVHRVKQIRRDLGLSCRQKKKFKATTNAKHNLPVAPNLLQQQFTASFPGQVWLTDITYISTAEGWLYLAGHKDLFTGEIVGYAMAARMTRHLVCQSLFQATASKRPPQGLIVHSDRGSQYCSHEYRRQLAQCGGHSSMSSTGNCFDNAPMESFWGILKSELIHLRQYATRREAQRDITEFIEIFYNRQRRQARLGYQSPAAFEKNYYEQTTNDKAFRVHY